MERIELRDGMLRNKKPPVYATAPPRPKVDGSLGWSYRPDADTVAALSRGVVKMRRHPGLGSDRPHEGGLLAKTEDGHIVEATSVKPVRRKKRRKKMARKVSNGSTKKTVAAAPSKKRTVKETASGKVIPLKTICKEMDLDPKATRVRLRRLIAKGDIKWHDPSSRWEFTPARAKEIRAHLAE